MLPQRRTRLHAALQVMRAQPAAPAAAKLGAWMNTWKGLGAVVDAMTAQGFDIEVQQYPDGWSGEVLPVRCVAPGVRRQRVGD